MKLSCFVTVSILWFELAQAYLLSSFNIQVFGDKKIQNPDITSILVKILSRYDLACIQEIRDADGDSFGKLVELLNREKPKESKYMGLVGERLGRTNSKEQYGLIYLQDKFYVSVPRTYSSYQTEFERPPMQVHVKPKSASLPSFELLIVHLDPQTVFREMEALYDIAQEIVTKKNENLLIVGDMNAGCSYLSKKKKNMLKLAQNPNYQWLIDDKTDTTVGKTSCAYDRIIVHGRRLQKAIIQDSAKAYRFSEVMGLDARTALKVSDHFPIEIRLRSRGMKRHRVNSSELYIFLLIVLICTYSHIRII